MTRRFGPADWGFTVAECVIGQTEFGLSERTKQHDVYRSQASHDDDVTVLLSRARSVDRFAIVSVGLAASGRFC